MDDNKSSRLYPTLSTPQTNDLNGKVENENAYIEGLEKYENHENPSVNPPENTGSERKGYKYFWKRVLKDLTNKNLIPVKILFFFKYATLFVLYPFLTLHMDSLGLDEWEIGVNQACVPIVAILGPPISGVIADKIGNFKIVLALITLVNAAVALLLLFVPVARETVMLPNHLVLEVSCDSLTNHFILNSLDGHSCTVNSSLWTNIPQTNLLQCGQLCKQPIVHTNDSRILTATNISLDFPNFPVESSSSIAFLHGNFLYKFSQLETQPSFLCTSNDGGTSEQCALSGKYATMQAGQTFKESDQRNLSRMTFSKLVLQSDQGHQHVAFPNESLTLNFPKFVIEGPIIFDNDLHDNPTCVQPSNLTKDDTQASCETKCLLQMDRKTVCTNEKERREYNVGLTFGIYTVFRLLLGFASATSFIMFEGAVLAILKRFGGDYGLQRVSATFAAIFAAPLSGLLLQYYSFQPVFYLYAALQTLSAILTLKIDLTFKKPAENVLLHLKEVLSQLEILIFFVAMLCSGTAWGYLESFLFLYLKQLGGSQTLMGLTISVGGIFGLPFLIFSRPIIKRFGHINILCVGLLFYGIRYFGYSFIENPWMCLPFEALESITASLAITAAATYAVALSTLQTIATVQGLMGALYFGIGRGAGSFIGGILIKKFGHRDTLQMFGIGSFIACLLYTLVNILYLRRHSRAGSGIDINNLAGTVISNGSAKMKPNQDSEQFPMKPSNLDSDLGYGKVNPGFEDIEDGTKFTDIPLDEDVSHPQNNNKPRA